MSNSGYSSLQYNSKSRWLSYWYQISEAIKRNPSNILLVGKGSGVVENVIATIAPAIEVVTLDNNPGLSPDVLGDIRSLPFEKSSFDCVICCQVLEHIPFEQVDIILKEFSNVVKDVVIISVPHKRKHIKVELDAPLIGQKMIILKYPFMKKKITSKQHYWEINRGISYNTFKKALRKYFIIEKTFLNEINCDHRFFILRKSESNL